MLLVARYAGQPPGRARFGNLRVAGRSVPGQLLRGLFPRPSLTNPPSASFLPVDAVSDTASAARRRRKNRGSGGKRHRPRRARSDSRDSTPDDLAREGMPPSPARPLLARAPALPLRQQPYRQHHSRPLCTPRVCARGVAKNRRPTRQCARARCVAPAPSSEGARKFRVSPPGQRCCHWLCILASACLWSRRSGGPLGREPQGQAHS